MMEEYIKIVSSNRCRKLYPLAYRTFSKVRVPKCDKIVSLLQASSDLQYIDQNLKCTVFVVLMKSTITAALKASTVAFESNSVET
jgi:hypothetical protein